MWLGLSAHRTSDGRLVCWDDDTVDFEDLVAALATPDLAAVLVMHTDVDAVEEALATVRRHWQGALGTYPHVGTWTPPNWGFDESFTPEELVRRARGWIDQGAQIVGGCCGLGPAYIRAVANDSRSPCRRASARAAGFASGTSSTTGAPAARAARARNRSSATCSSSA